MSGRRVPIVLVAALAVLGLAVLASLAFGARPVAWPDVVRVLTGGDSTDPLARAAVEQRVPRTVLAVLVGAALGVAGAALQGVTRNPLADPGILGISPGAALAVVVGIAFFGLSDPTSYLWTAIAGAAGAALLVQGVAAAGRGGPGPLRLALAGALTWAACSSLTNAVLLPRVDVLNRFRFWQVGGVGGADGARLATVVPFLVVGAVATLVAARALDGLALGDDVAAGLGVHVTRARLIAGAGAVTLCGAATAVAGPIGFVGLVVPHACRMLVGSAHARLLPLVAVAGAALLTVADVLGRVVARPNEIDVGIVTAFVGAPVFIALVRRQRLRAL